MANLALGHEVLNRSGDVLDRDFAIDPVLIKEVDAVGAKALEILGGSGRSRCGFVIEDQN